MRESLLAVRDDRAAMQRVVLLAERAAVIINEIDKIGEADRQSLLWHLSLIRELAVVPGRKIMSLCSLPKFDPPPGAA